MPLSSAYTIPLALLCNLKYVPCALFMRGKVSYALPMTRVAATLGVVRKQGRSHKHHSYFVSNHDKPSTSTFISNDFVAVCCLAHGQQSTQTNPKQRLVSGDTSTSTMSNSGRSRIIVSNNNHRYEAFVDKMVNQCWKYLYGDQ